MKITWCQRELIEALIVEESDGLTETGISASTLREIREHLKEENIGMTTKLFIDNDRPTKEKMLPA